MCVFSYLFDWSHHVYIYLWREMKNVRIYNASSIADDLRHLGSFPFLWFVSKFLIQSLYYRSFNPISKAILTPTVLMNFCWLVTNCIIVTWQNLDVMFPISSSRAPSLRPRVTPTAVKLTMPMMARSKWSQWRILSRTISVTTRWSTLLGMGPILSWIS